MLNCFYPLVELIQTKGDEYFDRTHPRADVKNPWDMTERGMKLFRNVYRDQTDDLLAPYEHFPELSWSPYKDVFLMTNRATWYSSRVRTLSLGF